ncbi:hypothetical protein D9M68_762790 [compost metagenome]
MQFQNGRSQLRDAAIARHDADPQRARHAARRDPHLFPDGARAPQDIQRAQPELFSGPRHGHAARQPGEQRRPQFGLERGDLPR